MISAASLSKFGIFGPGGALTGSLCSAELYAKAGHWAVPAATENSNLRLRESLREVESHIE